MKINDNVVNNLINQKKTSIFAPTKNKTNKCFLRNKDKHY